MDNHQEVRVQGANMEGVGVCDMGCVRKNNEDNMVLRRLWADDYMLAVAIDGVGGQEGGEVAAAIAADSISAYLDTYSNGDPQELLSQAVRQANNDILERRRTDARLENMSCVLTATIVDSRRGQVFMAHVGDTRLYLYADGQLRKLSHDHSLVGYREEQGDLTEEQAMHHPQRNIISRDVGSEVHPDADFVESAAFTLYGNSILMLCSDGLCDMITSAQMSSILSRQATLAERCRSLVESAKEAGGRDNVTVLLVNVASPNILTTARPNTAHQSDTSDTADSNEPSPVDHGREAANTAATPRRRRRGNTLARTLLVLLAVAAAAAIGFVAGQWCYGRFNIELFDNNKTTPTTAAVAEPPLSTYLSEPDTVKEFQTTRSQCSGKLEVMSLSQVTELVERTCYESVMETLSDSLTIIAVSHEIKCGRLVGVGVPVRCESSLTRRDSSKMMFESAVTTERGEVARCRSTFSIMAVPTEE